MTLAELTTQARRRWPERVEPGPSAGATACELRCEAAALPEVCGWLFGEAGYSFGGLVVEEGAGEWKLRYVFYGAAEMGWVHVVVRAPLSRESFPSIAAVVHAADWHEREVEDHFGLVFEGHPRLGDFVLHDDRWQEGLRPMRHGFDAGQALADRRPTLDRPLPRIVTEPGSFAMPVGPVFAGGHEPVHFLLETVGEDVVHAIPRLFYKYRGVEKAAEGRTVEEALVLAERFCGTSAFAHGLAFCQAAEAVSGLEASPRARRLRVALAELERLRHHVGALEAICASTGLAVAASQMAILHEDLLRLSAAFTGHRYLFGLLRPGGLTRDFREGECDKAVAGARRVAGRLDELEQMLRFSTSFLDRLEQVGVTPEGEARLHGLVGPVARAAGLARDLRRAQPYCGYEGLDFRVPAEKEGDGYARLRVLFAEAREATRLMEQATADLPAGSAAAPWEPRAGAGLGWAEAPRGAALHWLRIGDDEGRVARWRVMPPSFMNWHGFHLAAEDFAFQDFPIILATFDLSAAENDR